MRKLLYFIIVLGFIAIFLPIFLKKYNSTPDCPYRPIANIQDITELTEDGYKFKVDFSGKLNLYFNNKNSTNLDAEIGNSLDDYTKTLIVSKNFNKIDFVNDWNTLVMDICGKINLYNTLQLSPENKLKLEEAILERVINFYETLKPVKLEVSEKIDSLGYQIDSESDKILNSKEKKKVIEFFERFVVINENMLGGSIYLEDEEDIFLGKITQLVKKISIPNTGETNILKVKKDSLVWETDVNFDNTNKKIIFSSKTLVK